MLRSTREPAGGSAEDGDGPPLRIDVEVFEVLTERVGSRRDRDSPLILRWFDAWASTEE